MSRWAVRKLHPHVCGPDGTAWVAGEVGKWHNTVCSFRTYEEAMAYADEEARTREYVLPLVDDTTTIDEDDLGIMIFSIADHICITQPRLSEPSEIDVVAITPEFVEEVALALLAYAERMSE